MTGVAVLTPEQLLDLLEQAAEKGAARVLALVQASGGATDDLLSTEEAAKAVGVKSKTIATWIREKKLKAGRPGGRKWLIRRADLLACASGTAKAVDPRSEAARIAAVLRR